MELHLYKLKFQSHNPNTPEKEFNYFYEGIYRDAPPAKDGAKLVDAMRITDLLPGCISDPDFAKRGRDDVKVIETSRFTIKLDRQNAARSAMLNHTIDEFFLTDYLRKRKVFCRLIDGVNKYEGFIDIPSINWDFTWLDEKDDIEFDVEDPMQEFLNAQKMVDMQAVGFATGIAYDTYFAQHHFAHFINNGTVTYVIDRLQLQEKLGGSSRTPIISGPLQSRLITDNPAYKVYEATLGFSIGLGIMFRIESVDWDPAFQLQEIPFKLSYYLETDGLNSVEVENVRVHRRWYKWYNKQHVIIPYWRMDGPDYPGVSDFYFGLVMTADAQRMAFSDWNGPSANTPAIMKYTTGTLKDKYEVQAFGSGVYINVADTFLLDSQYPRNTQVQQIGLNAYKPIYPAYCRVLVTSFVYENVGGQMVYSNDDGFEAIMNVTAKKAYRTQCGEFVDMLTISVDFDENTQIMPGTELIFEGKSWLVERVYGINLEERRALVDAIINEEVAS